MIDAWTQKRLDDNPYAMLVRAYQGHGETGFLALLQSISWKEGYVAAITDREENPKKGEL
jgi:hypothetical protein